jgi:hypothetical protein
MYVSRYRALRAARRRQQKTNEHQRCKPIHGQLLNPKYAKDTGMFTAGFFDVNVCRQAVPRRPSALRIIR